MFAFTTFLISALGTAAAAANNPTESDVAKVLHSIWDKPASSFNPKSALTLNSVRLGQPYAATKQEVQVEGIPEHASVTPATVDFTVRIFYSNETQAIRRVRDARVYKDIMGSWAIMTGSPKTEDVRFTEPLQRP